MTLLQLLNSQDRMAATNGIQLTEVRDGYARAEMTVGPDHLNAGGVAQGGILFTLADLALAAVMNSHGQLTLGLGAHVTFLRPGRLGDRLTAEAVEVSPHHKVPYCEVRVTNEAGDLLCVVSGSAYRKDRPMPYDGLM